MTEQFAETFDVIIVGSGPTGAAYARTLADTLPTARVLMVEAGPVTTDPPGYHLSNITDDALRAKAQLASQGPLRGKPYAPMSEDERRIRLAGGPDHAMLRRPGLFVVGGGDIEGDGFPAGHAACNVGGMGAHWFGACPPPSREERVPFLANDVLDNALDEARALLRVSNTQFPESAIARPLETVLKGLFDAGRMPGRDIQQMPMALVRSEAGIRRSGPDVILGKLLAAPHDNFELRPDTVCRRIIMQGPRAIGVELLGADGAVYRVAGACVVAAADSLHTPQLLFASGVRPTALGHYLNEHPQVSALAIFETFEPSVFAAMLPDGVGGILADRSVTSLMSSGVTWIPYDGDRFPFHVQITQTDPASLPPADREAAGGKPVLSISFFLASEIVYDNAVSFSDTEQDWLGRPKMSIRYRLTQRDRDRMQLAAETWYRIANAIGRPLPGHTPRTPPNGSSLHYQGTMRMGAVDDGGSVCDPSSRVWGTDNLYVAGNGVLPTETAGNPTLTSVALATLGARDIARQLTTQATEVA